MKLTSQQVVCDNEASFNSICILVLKGRNVLPAHHRVCIFFALTVYDWFFYTLSKDFTNFKFIFIYITYIAI